MTSAIIRFAAAAAILAGSALTVSAAEPIEGTWKRPSTGTIVKYSGGGGQFCATVVGGKNNGKSIGCMKGSGANYTGQLIDLEANKTYSGKATVNGNSMSLKGCVAGGLICKGETWARQ
jgi:uncharacterized protein (DUF2147 family)